MKSTVIAALLLAVSPVVYSQTAGQDKKPAEERRIALLIGNENYAKLPPVTAAPKEVDLIRTALTAAKFKVNEVKNLTLDDLAKALDDFSAAVQPGDICFFYFSGYAAHNGEDDFLIPIDFNPSVGILRNNAYPLNTLATNLDANKPAFKMFFLEAARKIDANISDARPGLTIPTGNLTEVLFGVPTAPGQTVDTPPGQVGLFTDALARMIATKGLRITDLMPEVLKAVNAKSPGQRPTPGGSFTKTDFYFIPPDPVKEKEITKIVIEPGPSGRRQNSKDREFYVSIPPGKFMMGCVPSDKKCDKNEKPQHEVTISKGFWMGENEVKVGSYKRFVEQTKRKMPNNKDVFWNPKWIRDDHPISNMKWDDAAAYCSWAGGRLPTEAEWEYAARAGKQNQIYIDPENARGKAIDSGKAGNKDSETAPVQQFFPNAFKLFDMAGNVWEFVNDWFSAGYYAVSPAVDPPGPATGKEHVARGGSFHSDPKVQLRLSIRAASDAANDVGFRCVMNDDDKTQNILRSQ